MQLLNMTREVKKILRSFSMNFIMLFVFFFFDLIFREAAWPSG